MASSLDIKKLFEAGAHFGHRTSRWHPKMAPYIHSKRDNVHIIDLEKTVEELSVAVEFIEKVISGGESVLIVGTKRQARPVVKKLAEATGMPYVTERWLGGMLTNFQTISKRIAHLKKLEEQMESGELASKYSKLEVQRFQEEIDQLNTYLGSMKDMEKTPGAVIVFGAHDEKIAIRESNKLNVPVVGLVDTNTDPSAVDYPIPANDDAIKTLELIANEFENAINGAKGKQKKTAPKSGDGAEKK